VQRVDLLPDASIKDRRLKRRVKDTMGHRTLPQDVREKPKDLLDPK
jgi:hypothetical protein